MRLLLGYDLWQRRFGGDPKVIGRRILVGSFEHIVVGVMPPGFTFPKNQEMWTALRASPTRYARGAGPALFVFGRLAPGVRWEQAQAELTRIGRATAAAFPGANSRLRPQLLPYTYPLSNTRALQLADVAGLELVVNLLLIAAAVNVAMLVYARTATRQGEIAIRTALGATRRRIVGQLFVEALLLSLLGGAIGLAAAHIGLMEVAAQFVRGERAFWQDFGVQPRSAAFALLLAIVAAVIIGVAPGLKATGRGLNASLQLFRSGVSVTLGRTWTLLIVAQVALAVAVLPTALHIGYGEFQLRFVRAAFPAHEFLSVPISLAFPIQPGTDGQAYQRETAARFAAMLPELERTLEAEPSVVGATLEGAGGDYPIEIDEVAGSRVSGIHDVGSRGVATDYFDLFGARIVAGRAFGTSDVAPSQRGIIVSEAFVRRILRGEHALGRRIRFVGPLNGGQRAAGPWREIVGVVGDLYSNALDRGAARPMAYQAVAAGERQWVSLVVRVRGYDANAFIPRLQQITASRSPDVRLGNVVNLAAEPNSRYLAAVATGFGLALVTVLLLSAVGIQALMSLTVTLRRKEIGIRMALGASRGRLLASIFSRAALQLGVGGLVGLLLGAALLRVNGDTGVRATTFLGAVVALMLIAGLIAAARPALSGIRIQPVEALNGDN